MRVESRPRFRACILVLACAIFAFTRVPVYANSSPPTEPPSGAYSAYVMSRLIAASAYERDVRMCRGPVSDAQAVVIDDQEAVMYNPSFLDGLDDATGNPWASISVVAHELGHHFFGHGRLGTSGVAAESILDCELAADYFSGYVLARVGAGLADAQSAQRVLNGAETESHPDSARRLRAIEAGWRDGQAGLPISSTPIDRINALPVVVLPDRRACDGVIPVTLEARLDRW